MIPYQPPPVPTTEATVTITLPRPVPPADLHTAAVDENHTVVTQTVSPTCAVGERELTPKFIPRTVGVADPEVGPFGRASLVSMGASNEKAAAKVPSTRWMATMTARRLPAPIAEVHANAVFDVHDVVTQTVPPICAVGVKEPTPKLIPENVSVADPEVGPFGRATVSTGVALLTGCTLSDPAQLRKDKVVPPLP